MGRNNESSSLLLLATGLASFALLWYIVVGPPGENEEDGDDGDEGGEEQSALSRKKLMSVWTMLVKNMELHKFQIQQVLYQQRAQLAQQGTEVPEEHIVAMYKQNFEEILENVQQQILSHFDVTEEDLEAATEAFKDDPEIAKQVAELESLYLGEDAAGAETGEEVDIGVDHLEKIIVEDFGDAWCEAYEATMQEFQAQGQSLTEADQDTLIAFQSAASELAQENLAKLLEKDGLTPSDFQRLVLKHQTDPRINQALQHSQTQQAEALARMGLQV